MAARLLNIIPRKALVTAQTTQYTAPAGTKTLINKFTLSNTTGSPISFTVHLPAFGDTPIAGNLVLPSKTLQGSEVYLCPEIVGQSLETGGFISTTASATGLTISATGQEITN